MASLFRIPSSTNCWMDFPKILVSQILSPRSGLSEITIEEPEVIRQGNKFGVKIRSKSSSIHMIRAGIETEIAPIVGTEQQAEDLIKYIRESPDHMNGRTF